MLNALLSSFAIYAVDAIVAVVVLVLAIVSARRGFVECFFGFISTILAILLAFLFMKTFVRLTGGVFGLQGVIEKGCVNALSKIKGFDVDISSQGIEQTLSGKLPKFLINIVLENVSNGDVPTGTTVAMRVASTLSGFAINLIAWFILFLVIKLLIKLIERFLSSIINKLPIVGSLNTILGFTVGILQGLLIISGVIAVIALFPSESTATFFNDTLLVGVLYNHNPLHAIFSLILN